jgi:AraC-like DNA-binding protein
MSQVAERASLHTHTDYEVALISLNEDFTTYQARAYNSLLIVSTSGDTTVLIDDVQVELRAEHCCFLYTHGGNLYLAAEKRDAQVMILTFKDGFMQYSEVDMVYQERLKTLLHSFTSPYTFHLPSIHTTVLDLVHTQFSEHLISVFYRAKSLNIFCRLVEHLELIKERKDVQLREIDIEKVMMAKRIIETELSQNYTIPQLARKVGTNEQYLKKHFKLLFGKTVFGYILDCKMQKAKQMLKDQDIKVSSISQQLGYKHATHFTTAFKRFFGYVPNSLRYMAFITLDSIGPLGEYSLLVL